MPAHDKNSLESATVRITCTRCGADLLADESDTGKTATCPKCGMSIRIAVQKNVPARVNGNGKKATERLHLQDEVILGEGPTAADSNATPEDMAALEHEGHEARAKLAGWLRRVLVVSIALATMEVFRSIFATIESLPPANLHGMLAIIFGPLAAIPSNFHLLIEPRPVDLNAFPTVDRLFLGVAMLLFIVRFLLRSKLLDSLYVTTPRWRDRSNGGLVGHFLSLLLQICLLLWAAALLKVPGASEGLVCGVLCLLLLVSAVWLLALNLAARREYPRITTWMITDATFVFLLALVVLWPGLTHIFTRAGATAVLLFANSAMTLHPRATFGPERRRRPNWWHGPLYAAASCVIVCLVALILATVR